MSSALVGVVLAGGNGTRLLPLTKTVNKHLLAVNGQPMLHWPLRTLAQLGVGQAVVVLGGKSCGNVIEHFRSRYDTGEGVIELSYVYQEGAGGIPAALAVALPTLEAMGAGRAVVLLGDNVFPVAPVVAALSSHERNAVCVVKVVPDASSYGCVALDADGDADLHMTQPDGTPHFPIVEKPKEPPPAGQSWAAVLGMYVLPLWNLRTVIEQLVPSARGELEIVDVLLAYRKVYALVAVTTGGAWIDAGDPAGYALANDPAFWSGK